MYIVPSGEMIFSLPDDMGILSRMECVGRDPKLKPIIETFHNSIQRSRHLSQRLNEPADGRNLQSEWRKAEEAYHEITTELTIGHDEADADKLIQSLGGLTLRLGDEYTGLVLTAAYVALQQMHSRENLDTIVESTPNTELVSSTVKAASRVLNFFT